MKNKANTRKTNKKAVIAGIALAVIMVGGTLAAFLPSGSNPTNSSNSSSNNSKVIQSCSSKCFGTWKQYSRYNDN